MTKIFLFFLYYYIYHSSLLEYQLILYLQSELILIFDLSCLLCDDDVYVWIYLFLLLLIYLFYLLLRHYNQATTEDISLYHSLYIDEYYHHLDWLVVFHIVCMVYLQFYSSNHSALHKFHFLFNYIYKKYLILVNMILLLFLLYFLVSKICKRNYYTFLLTKPAIFSILDFVNHFFGYFESINLIPRYKAF